MILTMVRLECTVLCCCNLRAISSFKHKEWNTFTMFQSLGPNICYCFISLTCLDFSSTSHCHVKYQILKFCYLKYMATNKYNTKKQRFDLILSVSCFVTNKNNDIQNIRMDVLKQKILFFVIRASLSLIFERL